MFQEKEEILPATLETTWKRKIKAENLTYTGYSCQTDFPSSSYLVLIASFLSLFTSAHVLRCFKEALGQLNFGFRQNVERQVQ